MFPKSWHQSPARARKVPASLLERQRLEMATRRRVLPQRRLKVRRRFVAGIAVLNRLDAGMPLVEDEPDLGLRGVARGEPVAPLVECAHPQGLHQSPASRPPKQMM
jgi:hypothetical protein